MSGGIPTLTVTPSGISPSNAAAAYARVDGGGSDGNGDGFEAAFDRAISGAISTGNDAERASIRAIEGRGDITSVVTAVSRAELTLQAVTAIRDKVVGAYQTIMNMPI